MKYIKSQWLLVLTFSGVALTACHRDAIKPPVSAYAADLISSAVIRKPQGDDRSYAAILLPNQLQVVLVSDPTLETSVAALAVGVGSAQDPESQPGLAHYLEHMLFLGTKKYPVPTDLMEFVGKNGGMINATTSFERTNYFFSINAAKFEEALDRYSDYFKSPLLDPQYSDKERNAVNAEWSKNRDQDGWILHYIEGLTANPENPRSRFSIGSLETLADKNNSKLQDELKAFYNYYYSSNNMRLTLAGKQSIPELKVLAEKYFKDIPNKNIEIPKVTAPGLTPMQMGKIISYPSIQDIKELVLQFPMKDNTAEWRTKPNQIVASIIGSEEEGTLSQQLHKAGFINSLRASSSPVAYGSDGYFQVAVELTDFGLKNRDKVISAIFSYIDMVKTQGIDESYFRELQAVKAKDFVNGGKPDPLRQAMAITANQFEYPVENLLDARFVYDHFDQQAINNVLQQLQPTNVRIWYVGRGEVGDKTVPHSNGKYSIRDITAADRVRWDSYAKSFSFAMPAKNTLFTEQPAAIVDNIYIKPQEIISQKGIEIFLAQPEFYREDKGVLDIELNVDFAQKSAKNVVLSYLLSDIYATKNTALIDRAGRASLRLNAAVGATGSQFFNIEGYTTKHEELLAAMLSGFAGIKVSDKEFIQALDKYKKSVANNKKGMLHMQAMGHAQRLQSNTRWTDAELLVAAHKISAQHLVEYHNLIKSNLLVRIYAFGNYSEDTIKRFAKIVEQQLPGTRMPKQRMIPQFSTPKIGKDIVLTEKVDLPDNALVDIYMDDRKSNDQVAQMIVLNMLYSNEFFKQLRTEEQLGYAVYSFPAIVDEYAGFGMTVQSSNINLASIRLRMDRFRNEFITQLNALDPQQIEQMKNAEAANVLQKPTNFFGESKLYARDFWYGHYDFDGRERYLKSLEKVDKRGLIELYQRILLDKKSMNILVQLQGTGSSGKPLVQVKP